jgi:hypothetical protein
MNAYSKASSFFARPAAAERGGTEFFMLLTYFTLNGVKSIIETRA